MRLLHNPRCSKSRQALQLLRDVGIEPEVIEYMKTPPDAAELDAISKALGREPQTILRFGEDLAKELGLAPNDKRSRTEWLDLLARNPVLIERPIAIDGHRAVLGRPPDAVLALITQGKPV